MLSIFRTNQFIVNILLLFYTAALHLSGFLNKPVAAPAGSEPSGVLSHHLMQLLGDSQIWPGLMAIFLLFGQAVLLNLFFADNRITREYTLFPGLFYILAASAIPEFLHLSPILMANTFYLLALRSLFAVYRQPLAAGHIFNAGFWIGLAGLFYFSFIIFLFWGFLALNIMRAFQLRERFMMLIGLLTVYIITGAAYFFWDQWFFFLTQQFDRNIDWLGFKFAGTEAFYIKFALIGLLLLTTLLSYGSNVNRQTIDVQKKIDLIYWGLIFGGLTIFFQAGLSLDHLAILTVPIGILLALTFLQLSNRWAEAWHLLLLAAILLLQYKDYFVFSW